MGTVMSRENLNRERRGANREGAEGAEEEKAKPQRPPRLRGQSLSLA
jgi:hypothetical protein